MSETLAGTLITGVILLLVCIEKWQPKSWLPWVLLGALIAATALTRPNNLLFLPLAIVLILSGFPDRSVWRTRFFRSAVVAGVTSAPVLIWCTFIYVHSGVFGITCIPGFHLTHKTIDFVHLAPSEYADLESVLVQYEEPVLRANNNPNHFRLDSRIWYAIQEIRHFPKYRELPFRLCLSTMSKDLMKMDIALIEAHPGLYAQAVGEACVRFWEVDSFAEISLTERWDPRSPDGQNVVRSAQLQQTLGFVSRITIIPQYVGFAMLAAIGVLALVVRFGFGDQRIEFLVWLGLSTLVLAMLSCALVEYGNGRFIIPYLPIVFATASVGAWNLVVCLGGKADSQAPAKTDGVEPV